MKAILLGAGKGTRISRMVEAVPKSTLPIAGVPLIRRTVQMLKEAGIDSLVCVGYQQEKIREALQGLAVEYCFNPFYNVSNSIGSLWFARQAIADETLILNADVYFSKEILQLILEDQNDAVMAIDKSRTIEGDYFFKTTDNGVITKYGKELPLFERSCEYVGIAKIANGFSNLFVQRLEELMLQSRHELWWENVIYSFAESKEKEIHTLDVGNRFWAEIDFFDDYERILKYVEAQGVL